MVQTVTLPDGTTATFPDGATQEQILAALRGGLTDEQKLQSIQEAQSMREQRISSGLDDPSDIGLPTEIEQLPGLPRPLLEAVDAFKSIQGTRFGLDDPAAAQRNFGILTPLADIGAAFLETIGGGGLAIGSLAGDVASIGQDEPTKERARREFKALSETIIPGRRGAPSSAIDEFFGAVASRSSTLRGFAKAQPDAQQRQILEAGEATGVPIRTTDILPPQTFVGRSGQELAEKIPLVGTGGARRAQQARRAEAVEDVVQEFDIGLDTPFEAEIIKSLSETQKFNMTRAVLLRQEAVAKLNKFGAVPTEDTARAVALQVAKEKRLGPRANKFLINLLEDTQKAAKGNFELIKDLRTRVIQDIKKLQKGEHEVLSSQDEAALQAVKRALDGDLLKFARKNDKTAAAQWQKSNTLFVEEFTKFKNSELKRLLAKGDLTPEVVAPLLRGGKISELRRLNSNLTRSGQKSARAAIMRDALQKSGWPREINPDRFATELAKPNVQKAIKVFFKGDDKKQIEGLQKLLDATRRAQQARITTPTGQALLPAVGGVALITNPVATVLTASTIGGVANVYESPAVRNLLLKIANTPKNTKQFESLVAKAVPFILQAQAQLQEPDDGS